MANSKPEDQNRDYAVEGVDPNVEAKIDAMMNMDVSKKPATANKKIKVELDTPEETTGQNRESSSAPLLPDEKLPNFDEKNETTKANQPTDTKAEEPAVTVEQPTETTDLKSEKIDDPKTSLKDEIGVEDRATEAAVDEIIAEESDRILAIDDAKAELTKEGVNLNKKGFLSKIKSKFSNFWANPTARRLTIGSSLLVIITVFAVPTSRYFALNLVGVRASTSLRIVDDKTGQPLKNVEVSLSGQTGTTNIDGQVSLNKIKLGQQNMEVKKPAFADLVQKVTIGWGSNPMGDFKLTAVGSRYVFSVKDFLSDKPVDAEAISGFYSARSNDAGEIVLVVEDEKIETIDIQIIAKNYRVEKLNLPVGSKKTHELKLVPASKHAFVSKRSGKYDLYKIDVDGKNEEMILKGTGNENKENMVIMHHQTKNRAAFVSTRGAKYNEDGFALSSLNIVDLNSNEAVEIAESERIQLIDFIGDKLVYVKIKAGESAASPTRHRLVSYDTENGVEKELASSNYFNDVLSARGIIYYTPAEYKLKDQVGFYQTKPDGSEKYTIFSEEVWNLFRVSYHKINASVGKNWYQYDLGTAQFDKLEGASPNLRSRVYTDAPDGNSSIWVDERDGKGVLLLYNTETNEEDKALQTRGGLNNPIRWLDNDHVVYRVSDNSETADYVLSISGGEPKKIIDVTNTAGLDRWYYY